MNVTKVGRRGQIAIPHQIRQHLNLQQGDRLAFIQRDNEVVLQPLNTTLSDFRGSVPVTEPQDFDAIRQKLITDGAYRTASDDS